MRRCLDSLVLLITVITLAGCGSSPTAPGRLPGTPAQTSPAPFDPADVFARLAGPYTLTFEANESCPLPPSLKALSYDVVLRESRFRYIGVLVPGKPFVGDLWALASEEQGFQLRWNVDCEGGDTVGSTSFYLCGEGAAIASEGTISGVLGGSQGQGYLDADHRPLCANAVHRFVFRRRTS